MNKSSFVHLHVRSEYSIVDGISKIETLVNKAAFLKMPAIAITDFVNLFGLIKFYYAAYNVGVKPIIGADVIIKNQDLYNDFFELTILVINNIGYKNLILLISKAYKLSLYANKPVIDKEWLITHNSGLILLSGANKGDIGKHLMQGNKIQIEKCISFYEHYFYERFYIEIIRTERLNEEKYLYNAVNLAYHYNLPIVATNDVRFVNLDDFEFHKIRVAIQHGVTLNNVKKIQLYSKYQYLRSSDEMQKIFNDLPVALHNSIEIAKRCNVFLQLDQLHLPKFYTGNISAENYLIQCAQKGLKKRLMISFPNKCERYRKSLIYQKRLTYELKVINQMGFPGYFLIVMEFIQWSKNNAILVGPGRGSGAGSLVAYALHITDIDPLAFNLIFERFLNPERISMPDFDIDFCVEKRDLVIDHVSETYGRDSVSQIITFGTMTAKAVIRDVGRVLGYAYNFVNNISKLIPSNVNMTLKKALNIERKLKTLYDSDDEVKRLINIASKLEGTIRNVSKHAGGVVISPTKITDFVPLYYDIGSNNPVTQFDKNDIEHIGLVKFDFLGLKTLSIINETLQMINDKHKKNNLKLLDINNISLKDQKSFQILQFAKTTAVFQLESHGMKKLIKRLKPDSFEDLIALIALFRPGPLKSGMVDNFIDRKHGNEVISYPDKKWQHILLKPILESTYGIILYQEQVMQIAQILAGYTLGNADILRRAISKKNAYEMSKQRDIFKIGAKKKGFSIKFAMKIFDLLEKFANYGFNKSHSTAYALISYQTLWLKAHYSAEFMAAVMSADIDNTNRIVELAYECYNLGIKILPPNINNSKYYFYVNDNNIVYGIGAIKGIGKGLAENIIQERNKNGIFKGLFDLCIRINFKKINRRILEKLIMSGIFDCFNIHRTILINSIDNIIKITNQYLKNISLGQADMFGIQFNTLEISSKYYKNNNISKQITLHNEYEVLGLYLTGHPIDQYLDELKNYINIISLKNIYHIENGKSIIIAGLFVSLRIIITKNNHKIGICTINDQFNQIDLVIFRIQLEKYQYLLTKNSILIVKGTINTNKVNATKQIIVKELINIDQIREKYLKSLNILLNNDQTNKTFINKLNNTLKSCIKGNIVINIFYKNQNKYIKLFKNTKYMLTITNNLLNTLYKLIDTNQIEFNLNRDN